MTGTFDHELYGFTKGEGIEKRIALDALNPTARTCRCVYCAKVTAQYGVSGASEAMKAAGFTSGGGLVATICRECRDRGQRDERREVESGMRPWRDDWETSRSWGSGRFKPMPIEERRAAQSRWDAEQARIKKFNEEHSG